MEKLRVVIRVCISVAGTLFSNADRKAFYKAAREILNGVLFKLIVAALAAIGGGTEIASHLN